MILFLERRNSKVGSGYIFRSILNIFLPTFYYKAPKRFIHVSYINQKFESFIFTRGKNNVKFLTITIPFEKINCFKASIFFWFMVFKFTLWIVIISGTSTEPTSSSILFREEKFTSGLRLHFPANFEYFFADFLMQDSKTIHMRVIYQSKAWIFYFYVGEKFWKSLRTLMENRQSKFKEFKIWMWNHIHNLNIENLFSLSVLYQINQKFANFSPHVIVQNPNY